MKKITPHRIATLLLLLAGTTSLHASPLAPVITPSGGSYHGSVPVEIGCFTPGSTIHYSTDGSLATAKSPVYRRESILTISADETVSAVALDASGAIGPVTNAAFRVVRRSTTYTPTISPDGGNTTSRCLVSLSCATPGASIYYTTDGSVPTMASLRYTSPFVASGAATIVRALATAREHSDSAIAKSTFFTTLTSQVAKPVITSTGTTFDGWTTVTAATSTGSSVLRYTSDGSSPTAKSTIYSGSITVYKSESLKVRGFADGLADSDIASAAFTADNNPPTVVDVSSYGASPTLADNSPAIQACLNAVQNGVQGSRAPRRIHIVFAPGIYRISTTLNLSRANNIDIDGQGSTLLGTNRSVTAFNVSDSCANITIENVTFDELTPPNIPGYVTESTGTNGSNSFDLLLDPGFSYPAGETLNGITQYDPVTRAVSHPGVDISFGNLKVVPTQIGPNKVHILLPYGLLTRGMYVNLATHGVSTLTIFTTDGFTLRNVQIYSGYQLGMFISNCVNVTLSHVSVLRKPGSNSLTSNAVDDVHAYANKGPFDIEDCDFEYQGDDAINFASDYETIKSVSGNTVTMDRLEGFYKPGDLMEFRSGRTMLPLGSAVVQSVSGLTLTLSSVPTGIMPGSDMIHNRVWEASPTVNRCNFIGNRARGILVQTPNAVVENCRFSQISMSAIHVCTVIPWMEGTAVSFVTLRNNSIDNCDGMGPTANGSIAIFALKTWQDLGAAGVHKNVVVEDNTIASSDNPGIQVAAADDIDVINNTLFNVARVHDAGEPMTNYAIVTQNASNVRYRDNNLVNGNSLQYVYNPWMPSAPPGGINVQPYIVRFSQTGRHMARWVYSWNVQDIVPAGEAVFVHICDARGNIVAGVGAGDLHSPSSWSNGGRTLSSPVPVDLEKVPDGTYSVRMGLYAPQGRLKLTGLNDGESRIVVGSLKISQGGGEIRFMPSSLDIRPRVAAFRQLGPRGYCIAYAWDVHDTVPPGYKPFAVLCNAAGDIVTHLPMAEPLDPNRWTSNSDISSSLVSATLPPESIVPDGVYTVRMGLYSSTKDAELFAMTGDTDIKRLIITGTLISKTTNSHSIWADPVSAPTVSMNGNTGF